MATALKTKPGINGANVLSIPTEWDATWFRRFIDNSLKGADVRNAIGANGITVTGNISSPYATISGGGPTNFTAPIVINSTAGQVSLTVNGAAGQNAAVFNNGPVVINDTAGPFGLTVNGDGTDVTMLLNTPSGRFSGLYLQKGSVTEAELFFDATANQLVLSYDVAGSTFRLRSPNGDAVNIGAFGGVVILQPTSGAVVGLTVNGPAAGQIGVFKGIAGNSYFDYQRSGVLIGRIGSADSIIAGGANTDFALSTPGGGLNIATGGSSASAFTLSSTGQLGLPLVTVTSTSPAAGGAGALPATPAGYMAVTIAGTSRRIPFYT